MIFSLEEEHAGNHEENGDRMDTLEAEELDHPPGPSITHAWTNLKKSRNQQQQQQLTLRSEDNKKLKGIDSES